MTRTKTKPLAGQTEGKTQEKITSEDEGSGDQVKRHEHIQGLNQEDHTYVKRSQSSDKRTPEEGAAATIGEALESVGINSPASIPVTVEEVSQHGHTVVNQGKTQQPGTSYVLSDMTRGLGNVRFDAGDVHSIPQLPIFNHANTSLSSSQAVPRIAMTVQSGVGDTLRNMNEDPAPVGDDLNLQAPVRIASMHHAASITEPKQRLPTFDGRQNWDAFWVQFEFIADQFGWDANKKLSYLMSSLRELALEFVSKIPLSNRASLPGLIDALKHRFGDNVRPETYRASLDMIKKEPKENLHEYAAKVREIMAKAYPGLEGSELFTEMLVERIVKGLPDTNLVYDVLSK